MVIQKIFIPKSIKLRCMCVMKTAGSMLGASNRLNLFLVALLMLSGEGVRSSQRQVVSTDALGLIQVKHRMQSDLRMIPQKEKTVCDVWCSRAYSVLKWCWKKPVTKCLLSVGALACVFKYHKVFYDVFFPISAFLGCYMKSEIMSFLESMNLGNAAIGVGALGWVGLINECCTQYDRSLEAQERVVRKTHELQDQYRQIDRSLTQTDNNLSELSEELQTLSARSEKEKKALAQEISLLYAEVARVHVPPSGQSSGASSSDGSRGLSDRSRSFLHCKIEEHVRSLEDKLQGIINRIDALRKESGGVSEEGGPPASVPGSKRDLPPVLLSGGVNPFTTRSLVFSAMR